MQKASLFLLVVLLGFVAFEATLGQALWSVGVNQAVTSTMPTSLNHSIQTATKSEAIFTVIPLNEDAYYEIIPLGNLNPPSHTFPSDHIYFVLNNGVYNVSAPADGTIIKIRNTTEDGKPYQDYSVYIRHTNTFKSYFHHLSGLADWIINQVGKIEFSWDGVAVSIPVKAGDIIGIASKQPGGSVCLDWGAIDYTVNLSFIHPETYSDGAHAVCPLDYLEDNLKEAAYSKVHRVGEPRGGKIDYDMLGRLSGNWFFEGIKPNVWDWSMQLAFVYHVRNASQMVVSNGGTLLSPLPVGVFNATGPDFREVSVEDGVVTYHLARIVWNGREYVIENYTLIAQVIGDEKIKVEVFEGHQEGRTFTDKAKVYTRTGPYSPQQEQTPSMQPEFLSGLLLALNLNSTYYLSRQQTILLYAAICSGASVLVVLILLKRVRWQGR